MICPITIWSPCKFPICSATWKAQAIDKRRILMFEIMYMLDKYGQRGKLQHTLDLMVSIPFSKFFLDSEVCNGPSKVPFSNGSPTLTCLYTLSSWSITLSYMLSWRSFKTQARKSSISKFFTSITMWLQIKYYTHQHTSLRHVVHRWPAVPTAANKMERTANWISASSITIIALFPLSSSKHLPNLWFTVCCTIKPTCRICIVSLRNYQINYSGLLLSMHKCNMISYNYKSRANKTKISNRTHF